MSSTPPTAAKAPVKGLQDHGARWKYRYLTKYVFKTHYPLVVLHVCTFGTVAFSFAVLFRSMLAPEVNVDKRKVAYENLSNNHKFQFYSPNVDFKKMKDPRPKYD